MMMIGAPEAIHCPVIWTEIDLTEPVWPLYSR